MNLRSNHINNGSELYPYMVRVDQKAAIDELRAHLSPLNGPLRRVVSYFGADHRLHVSTAQVDQYDLNHVIGRIAMAPSLDTSASTTIHGGGKGYSLADTFLSTMGEGIERMVACLRYFANEESYRFGTSRDLSKARVRHLGPSDIALFAPEQTDLYAPQGSFQQFTKDTPLSWIAGTSLITGEQVYVPAQLAEFFYLYKTGEAHIGYSQSGGLSCHTSMDEAVYHGLTELIERDAINLRWYTRMPPVRVELDSGFGHDLECNRLIRDLREGPVETQLFYHNIDIPEVSVFTAIRIEPYHKEFSYAAGGGADMCPVRSLVKTLNEFGQCERTLRLALLSPEKSFAHSVKKMFSVRHDAKMEEFDLFFKVVGYYGDWRNRSKLDWYLTGDQSVRFSTLVDKANSDIGSISTSDRLARLLEVLRRNEIEPIVLDMSPPQWNNLRIVKVFVPQLCTPFLPSKPVLGHPRYRDARKIAGISMEPVGFHELVTDPLPYP